jgi:hypothetical protein
VREAQALFGEGVEIGRPDFGLAEGADVAIAEIVGKRKTMLGGRLVVWDCAASGTQSTKSAAKQRMRLNMAIGRSSEWEPDASH